MLRLLREAKRICGLPETARVKASLPLAWGVLNGWPEFGQLPAALTQKKTTAYRQVLSHHTTTSCQPGRIPGPVPSLRAAGIGAKLPTSSAYWVEVRITASFAHGDGLWVRYVSASQAKFEDCKSEAALDLLVLLLANRPYGVHLHGSTWANIPRVRDCAARLHQAALRAPGVPAGTPDMTLARASDRPEPRPRGQIPASPQQITTDAEQELREL